MRTELEQGAKWLMKEAKRIVQGCKILAFDGKTWCYTPDATGTYGGMWTRDFYYMADPLPVCVPKEELKAACVFLLGGQREDGVVPDRRYADGVSAYSAGPVGNPTGAPPTDNASFLVKLVAAYVKRTGDISFFETISAKLEKALDSLNRSDNGLVYIKPGTRQSSFGFVDQLGMTGNVLFASILFIEAAQCMAQMYDQAGKTAHAGMWRLQSERSLDSLQELWDEEEGMYYAASVDNRQIDLWGSCYLASRGMIAEEHALRISKRMVRDYEKAVKFGQVRHLFYPEFWNNRLDLAMKQDEMMGITCAPGKYQNGAYWSTSTGWVAGAIRLTDPGLADRMLLDVLENFQKQGVNEAVNDDPEYIGAQDYVVSATLVLEELVRVGIDAGVY